MTASFSESVHQCRGWTSGTAGTATPDPLVVELAQVLVQPQFLSMVQAGTACAERHARSSNIDVMGRMTSSASFMVLTEWWMSCLHTCFCISSPPPLGLASPELQQAALSWLPATLALIKADSWLGAWPADALSKLIHFGLAVPLVILIQRVELQRDAVPSLPWADRLLYLECALQAAEWMLSAVNMGGDPDDRDERESDIEQTWEKFHRLANSLIQGAHCRKVLLLCLLF